MKRNIFSFISIWVLLCVLSLFFAVYQDIRINKLFNYTTEPKNLKFEEKAEVINGMSNIEYRFTFSAIDNYLGAVIIPVKALGNGEGKISALIKEVGSEKVVHENVYDYNYFRHFDKFAFGFPVIENSKNVNYEAVISFYGINNFEHVINKNERNLLLTKFVFPKTTVLNNPLKLIDIVKNRAIVSSKNISYTKIFMIILILSLIVMYISNTDISTRIFTTSGSYHNLFKSIFRIEVSSLIALGALFLTILIPILVLTNHFTLAEKMANYVWIFLLLAILWYVISNFITFSLPKIIAFTIKIQRFSRGYFKSENLKRNLVIILLLLITISGFTRVYQLGGDDSRLFYLYPKEFLENFAIKIVSDTSMSNIVTLAPSATTAFTILMVVLKKVVGILNLQSMLYTANIIGGIIFFYLFLGKLIPSKDKNTKLINICASLFYVFSIFNAYTVFSSKLLAIYLVSLFPLSIYLFIRAVDEKKPHFVFLIAIISSIFSFLILMAPWLLAAVITTLPLLIYKLWSKKVRTISYLLLLGVLMLILNFHWIIYIPYTSFSSGNEGTFNNSLISPDYRRENENGIRVVSDMNSVFYPLMGVYHAAIQKNNSWSNYSIFYSWYERILPVNIFFVGVISIAGILLKKTNSRTKLYVYALFSFLLAVYLFTVNITNLGIPIFVWLNNTIPGFVIFRNMYDKFGYSMAFALSVLIAVSTNIVVGYLKNMNHKRYIILMLIVVSIVNSKPLLFGEFDRLPLWTTQNTHILMKAFNEDFIEMISYIKKVDNPGKYLVLPLSTGNSFSIRDKYQDNFYYSGTSPLLALTGKNDFSGLLSFGNLGEDVRSSIKNKDYQKLGKVFQKLNIKYIIINRDVSADLQNSFVYSDGFYYLQNKEMFESLVGPKIKDFGQRYSLYEIKRDFNNEKIYLTSHEDTIPNEPSALKFTKIDSHLYEVKVDSIHKGEKLIFLDPYQDGWEIFREGDNTPLNARHFTALGYANGWEMKDDLGSNGIVLKLYFKPYDYYWPSNAVSIFGYIFCFSIVIKNLIKYINKR